MKSKDFLEILIPIIIIVATTLFEKVRAILRERRRRHSPASVHHSSPAAETLSKSTSVATTRPHSLVEVQQPAQPDKLPDPDEGQLHPESDTAGDSAAFDWRRAIIASEILNNKFINKTF